MNSSTQVYRNPNYSAADRATLTSPRCDAPISDRVRLIVETVRHAALHPALPELLVACRCGELVIVGIWPVSAEGVAA